MRHFRQLAATSPVLRGCRPIMLPSLDGDAINIYIEVNAFPVFFVADLYGSVGMTNQYRTMLLEDKWPIHTHKDWHMYLEPTPHENFDNHVTAVKNFIKLFIYGNFRTEKLERFTSDPKRFFVKFRRDGRQATEKG